MENEPIREIKQIEFPITEITNKAMRQIKLTTEAVSHLYHSAINYKAQELIPLQTDSLAFVVTDENFDNNPEAVKKRALDWLFKKSFEEFIVGLSESLIEAYKFTKYFALSIKSKQDGNLTLEAIEAQIQAINTKPHELSFPVLITAIEKELQIELPLRTEILSINKIRNCLVHRNSIVSKLDIKNDPANKLRLHYVDLVTFYENDGEMTEMKWEHKKDKLQTNKLQFVAIPKTIEFNEGDHILLDQNVFNAIAYTCTSFIQNLHTIIITPHLDKIKIKQPM